MKSVPIVNLQRRESPRTNVGPFAGAVGGSVGLLFILSLGLAVNLYRRKRAARDRAPLPVRDDASLFTEGSNDHSQIGGPSPFIPRYFPEPVHQLRPCAQRGQVCGDGRNSSSSTGYAERPPPAQLPQLREEAQPDLNAHKETVISPPSVVYAPGRAIHPSV